MESAGKILAEEREEYYEFEAKIYVAVRDYGPVEGCGGNHRIYSAMIH